MANALTDARIELRTGARALGLSLDEMQVDHPLACQGLLARWDRVYNLTAIRNAGDMLTHHSLDSLSAVSRVIELIHRTRPNAPRMLDVGSGGGLPGVPLVITFPDVNIMMVGIMQKKTAFLTQCCAELGLANAQSYWGHIEKLVDATSYGVITSCAFAELVDPVGLVGHLLTPGGRMIAMKDVHPDVEIERLPAGWAIETIEHLTAPRLPAGHHLAILTPSV